MTRYEKQAENLTILIELTAQRLNHMLVPSRYWGTDMNNLWIAVLNQALEDSGVKLDGSVRDTPGNVDEVSFADVRRDY